MKLLKLLSLNLLFLFPYLSSMEFMQEEAYNNDGEKEVAECGEIDPTSIIHMIKLNPKNALKVFCDAARCGNAGVVGLFLAAQEDHQLKHTGLLVPMESGRPGLSMAEAFFRSAGIKKVWRTPTKYEYIGLSVSNNYMDQLKEKQLPLKRAVLEENLGMISLLIENGSDLHAVDDLCSVRYSIEGYDGACHRDISALELAVKLDNPKVICMMLRAVQIIKGRILSNDSFSETTDQTGLLDNVAINDTLEKTVLYAARYNSINSIKFLDLCAIDWDTLMQKSTEALNEAAKCNSREVAEWLIEHVDINATLMKAVRQRHREAVALLLAHGAASDGNNDDGTTPLMVASSNGYEKIVSLLLQSGATVNSQDVKGKTALMSIADKKAARFGPYNRKQIAELLVAGGADVNIQNAEGKVAAVIAAEHKDFELADFLLGQNDYLYNVTTGQSLKVEAIKVEQRSTDLFEWTKKKSANLFEQAAEGVKSYFRIY